MKFPTTIALIQAGIIGSLDYYLCKISKLGEIQEILDLWLTICYIRIVTCPLIDENVDEPGQKLCKSFASVSKKGKLLST